MGAGTPRSTSRNWYSAIYFTEEDTDPAKNPPRALLGGVLCLTAIYVAFNLALVAVLPRTVLANSALPAADAAAVLFGARASTLITLLSIVSLLGIIHPVMMMGTRVLFAVAREERPASELTRINAGGTPAAALLTVAIVAAALLLSGTFDRLFAMVAIYVACNYIAAMVALILLRRREPELARPIRTWGYPWTVGLVLAISSGFLIGAIVADPMNSAAALLLIAAAWPVRRLFALGTPATEALPIERTMT